MAKPRFIKDQLVYVMPQKIRGEIRDEPRLFAKGYQYSILTAKERLPTMENDIAEVHPLDLVPKQASRYSVGNEFMYEGKKHQVEELEWKFIYDDYQYTVACYECNITTRVIKILERSIPVQPDEESTPTAKPTKSDYKKVQVGRFLLPDATLIANDLIELAKEIDYPKYAHLLNTTQQEILKSHQNTDIPKVAAWMPTSTPIAPRLHIDDKIAVKSNGRKLRIFKIDEAKQEYTVDNMDDGTKSTFAFSVLHQFIDNGLGTLLVSDTPSVPTIQKGDTLIIVANGNRLSVVAVEEHGYEIVREGDVKPNQYLKATIHNFLERGTWILEKGSGTKPSPQTTPSVSTKYTVELSSVANPDFMDDEDNIREEKFKIQKPTFVAVDNLRQAQAVVREFVSTYDLGSGNFTKNTGVVKDAEGQFVARISYNGKVMDNENASKIGKEIALDADGLPVVAKAADAVFTPKFKEGDEVEVIDEDSEHYGETGIIKKVNDKTQRYNVEINGKLITGFHIDDLDIAPNPPLYKAGDTVKMLDGRGKDKIGTIIKIDDTLGHGEWFYKIMTDAGEMGYYESKLAKIDEKDIPKTLYLSKDWQKRKQGESCEFRSIEDDGRYLVAFDDGYTKQIARLPKDYFVFEKVQDTPSVPKPTDIDIASLAQRLMDMPKTTMDVKDGFEPGNMTFLFVPDAVSYWVGKRLDEMLPDTISTQKQFSDIKNSVLAHIQKEWYKPKGNAFYIFVALQLKAYKHNLTVESVTPIAYDFEGIRKALADKQAEYAQYNEDTSRNNQYAVVVVAKTGSDFSDAKVYGDSAYGLNTSTTYSADKRLRELLGYWQKENDLNVQAPSVTKPNEPTEEELVKNKDKLKELDARKQGNINSLYLVSADGYLSVSFGKRFNKPSEIAMFFHLGIEYKQHIPNQGFDKTYWTMETKDGRVFTSIRVDFSENGVNPYKINLFDYFNQRLAVNDMPLLDTQAYEDAVYAWLKETKYKFYLEHFKSIQLTGRFHTDIANRLYETLNESINDTDFMAIRDNVVFNLRKKLIAQTKQLTTNDDISKLWQAVEKSAPSVSEPKPNHKYDIDTFYVNINNDQIYFYIISKTVVKGNYNVLMISMNKSYLANKTLVEVKNIKGEYLDRLTLQAVEVDKLPIVIKEELSQLPKYKHLVELDDTPSVSEPTLKYGDIVKDAKGTTYEVREGAANGKVSVKPLSNPNSEPMSLPVDQLTKINTTKPIKNSEMGGGAISEPQPKYPIAYAVVNEENKTSGVIESVRYDNRLKTFKYVVLDNSKGNELRFTELESDLVPFSESSMNKDNTPSVTEPKPKFKERSKVFDIYHRRNAIAFPYVYDEKSGQWRYQINDPITNEVINSVTDEKYLQEGHKSKSEIEDFVFEEMKKHVDHNNGNTDFLTMLDFKEFNYLKERFEKKEASPSVSEPKTNSDALFDYIKSDESGQRLIAKIKDSSNTFDVSEKLSDFGVMYRKFLRRNKTAHLDTVGYEYNNFVAHIKGLVKKESNTEPFKKIETLQGFHTANFTESDEPAFANLGQVIDEKQFITFLEKEQFELSHKATETNYCAYRKVVDKDTLVIEIENSIVFIAINKLKDKEAYTYSQAIQFIEDWLKTERGKVEKEKNKPAKIESLLDELHKKCNHIVGDKSLNKIERLVKMAEVLEGYYVGDKGELWITRVNSSSTIKGYFNGERMYIVNVNPIKVLLALENLVNVRRAEKSSKVFWDLEDEPKSTTTPSVSKLQFFIEALTLELKL